MCDPQSGASLLHNAQVMLKGQQSALRRSTCPCRSARRRRRTEFGGSAPPPSHFEFSISFLFLRRIYGTTICASALRWHSPASLTAGRVRPRNAQLMALSAGSLNSAHSTPERGMRSVDYRSRIDQTPSWLGDFQAVFLRRFDPQANGDAKFRKRGTRNAECGTVRMRSAECGARNHLSAELGMRSAEHGMAEVLFMNSEAWAVLRAGRTRVPVRGERERRRSSLPL